ncbi:MAG: epoxyqueuosine reductase QueH [Patescibacteria group bacterium]
MPKPRLLLHVCCGVCSAYIPELLLPEFDVTVYFENSNIYPSEEFDRRCEAAQTMAKTFDVPFIEAERRPVEWYRAVAGHAQDPERGARCGLCIKFRLQKTFAFAKEQGFDWVATTLSVSRRKNVATINALGEELSRTYDVAFLGRDWKKGNGEVLSQNRAREAGIYRQDYCGCVYSWATR